ncbi:MAG: DUF3108 domain-containing protein [Bacteroidota bacterium]
MIRPHTKNSLTLYTLLCVCFTVFTTLPIEHARGQLSSPQSYDACVIKNSTFQAGEEMVYKLYYNWNFVWIPAGEVTFSVQETAQEYQLSAVGRTYSSYNKIFKVEDRYDSFVQKSSLLPSTSIRHIQEGGYRLYDKTTLHQQDGRAISKRGKTPEDLKIKEHQIEQCMHDVLSVIYYARNLDFDTFQEGDEFPVKIFLDEKTYPLQVKYKGKQSKKSIKGQGKYQTILFSPQLITGDTFKKGDEMNIWVTDDQNRMPVLIESPLSVGSVKVVLKSYKGLKYNVTAKVK